jgi:glucose 1-dehydrogenase
MATQTIRENLGTNRLDGRIAVITGGDEGIGRAIALRLAAEGADIGFCYRKNRAGADEVLALLKNQEAGGPSGRRAHAWQADVSNTGQAEGFIASAFDHFGSIDILVNNAGLERRANFWEVSEQDYDLVVNVNLKGVFFSRKRSYATGLPQSARAKSSISVPFTRNCRSRTSLSIAPARVG